MRSDLDIRAVLERLIAPLVLGFVFLLSPGLIAGEGLSEADFRRLHKELQVSGKDPWRTIPWKISLLDAQRAAQPMQGVPDGRGNLVTAALQPPLPAPCIDAIHTGVGIGANRALFGDAVSAEAVKSAIRALIASEGDTILSDDTLVEMLNAKGFGIARRTVAKYREAMGIGSSVQRRRAKALQRA